MIEKYYLLFLKLEIENEMAWPIYYKLVDIYLSDFFSLFLGVQSATEVTKHPVYIYKPIVTCNYLYYNYL